MLGVTDYGAFVFAIVILLVIPGPGNLALITSTTKGGILGGLGATFGIILGDQVLMWCAVAGVATLLNTYPAAFQLVQWLGSAYLVWMGAKMLLAKQGDAPILNIKPKHYLRQGLTITLLNPKAIVFYVAFFPLFIDPLNHQGFVTFALMSSTVAALAFVYGIAVVLLTYYLADHLRANPRVSSAMEKIAGLCLIGFGIKLFFGR